MTREAHDRRAGATRPAAVDAMLDDPATRGRVADLLLDAEPGPDETVDEVAGKLKRDSNDGSNDDSNDGSNGDSCEDTSEDSIDGGNNARRSPRPVGSTADGSARSRSTAGAGPGRMRAGAADGPATLRGTWTARAALLASALSLAGFLGADFPEAGPGGSVGSRRGSVGFPIASREVPFERSDAMRSLPRGVRFGSLSGTLRSGLAATVATLAAAPAVGADAVQWRVEDGGNGHWYEGVSPQPLVSWTVAQSVALSRGGHLVTTTSSAELEFVFAHIASRIEYWHLPPCGCLGIGPWLGLSRTTRGWQWVTGEPYSFTAWHPGEPWEPSDFVRFFNYVAPLTPAPLWDNGPSGDEEQHSMDGTRTSYIIEWSADCDGNGLVDFGEIHAGVVVDSNANNIPDACECATNPALAICCPGDVVLSGEVNGVDLAAVLGAWGTDGGKFPRADIDGSGVVDGADLTIVLNDWGVCE